MRTRERIIISITSWWKRINNVRPVLETILNQTLQPNKILVNLCIQDFPNMEEDLPKDLVELVEANRDRMEIYWFLENYKAWKKHLHAMEIAGPDDLIMSIDDDHLYPADYIEKMYVSYLYYGKMFPVTLNKDMMFQNLWCFNGPGVLYRKKDFGDNWQRMFTQPVLRECANDIAATLMFAANHTVCMPMMFHMPKDDDMLFNDNAAYTDKRSVLRSNEADAKSQIDTINDLHESTGRALEDTFIRNNMLPPHANFSPNFWYFCFDMAKYMETEFQEPRYIAMQKMIDMHKEEPLRPNAYGLDYASMRLDLHRKASKSELIGEDNKLVITLSSWPKRVANVATVIDDIFYNTMTPDVFVLNLAKPDFGVAADEEPSIRELYKKGLVPEELYRVFLNHSEVTIHWYEDATIKSWKKHLYVLDHFSENDVIICIDDDIRYRETFIETMLKSYDLYGRRYPVTGCDNGFVNGMYSFHGSYTLYTPGVFKGYRRYMTETMLHRFPEDNHLGAMLALNGHMILPVIGSDYLVYGLYNETDPNYGNGVFDEKWFRDYGEMCEESNHIIERERGGDALIGPNGPGWNPPVFNFTHELTKKFLDSNNPEELPYPFNIIYASVKYHYETNFGEIEDKSQTINEIRNIVL